MCALKRDIYGRKHPPCTHGAPLWGSALQFVLFPAWIIPQPSHGWDPTGRVGLSQEEKWKGTQHSALGSDFFVNMKKAAGTRTRKSNNVWSWGQGMGVRCDQTLGLPGGTSPAEPPEQLRCKNPAAREKDKSPCSSSSHSCPHILAEHARGCLLMFLAERTFSWSTTKQKNLFGNPCRRNGFD